MDTATSQPATTTPAPRARVPAVFSTVRQAHFLEAFTACGSVQQAARWSHCHRRAHYEWLKNDPTYAPRFDEALKAAARKFEDEAVRRAVHGTTKGVYYKGKKVAVEREYSDQLLALLLKANNPDKFGDKSKIDMSVRQLEDPSQIPLEVLIKMLPVEKQAAYLEQLKALEWNAPAGAIEAGTEKK